MNIYFISPININIGSWKALLNVLNIECVVDLLSYKESANNPFTCNNEVFDDISTKYNINDLLPKNLSDLSKEKRLNAYKSKIQKIFASLVEYGINKYKYKSPIKDGITIKYLKDKWNVLVLSPILYSNLINYCSKYFCNKLYNSYKQSRDCIQYIDLFQIDFMEYEAIVYNKNNNHLDSTRSKLWRLYDNIEVVEFIESKGAEIWYNLFEYDIWANAKKCNMLDEIFLLLENEHYISEKRFFKNDSYERIINVRKKNDLIRIDELRKIEERRREEEFDKWDETNEYGKSGEWDEWNNEF